MRPYSIVLTEFWTGRTGKELRKYPAETRELAAYLFSCPGHEMYGLYYKPIETMKLELGRPEKVILAGLITLGQLEYCVYDPTNEWVWVFEMAQIQMGLPLKATDYKVRAANRWYQTMPRNAHLGPFFDRYCDSLHLDPPRRSWESTSALNVGERSIGEGALQQPLTSVPESDQRVVLVGEARSKATERFDRFWEAYPWKVGKKAARLEWDKINPDDALTDRIVQAVERHKRSPRWLRDNGQAIPDPERYIKKERWNDDYTPPGPSASKQTLKNVQGPLGSFLDGI